ncbi:unnamed protein product [Caenorhabditis sp. 36 PRJEB53466]|nr:unnamed protein product [Caenorhabditis sp. 36 PRJEB53466]
MHRIKKKHVVMNSYNIHDLINNPEESESDDYEDYEDDYMMEMEQEQETGNGRVRSSSAQPVKESNGGSEEVEPIKLRKLQEFFTVKETRSIFHFLLGEIRSQNKHRLGRVAKRRIEIGSIDLWTKFKKWSKGRREPAVYRGHYRMNANKLHTLSGLSMMDKLDLYYALDIKVNKLVRRQLTEEYGLEMTDEGVITGSSVLKHWDLVHPDSDQETEGPLKINKRKGWLRFTEKDDGLMWQFVLDYVQQYPDRKICGTKVWVEFMDEYKYRGIAGKRTPETYRGRYHRILEPNLYLMPIDIETKAALYQSLNVEVPLEFRRKLINETGVRLAKDGKVIEYANRPEHPVLQSRVYEDLIGIHSANRTSTLKKPGTGVNDRVPYTAEEDHDIWEFIINSMRNKHGKPLRNKKKMTGWVLWRACKESMGSERQWQSLSQHFIEHLMDNVMATEYDLKTKIELYFFLDLPVDEEVLRVFETEAIILLNRKRVIRHAMGKHSYWGIGRKDIIGKEGGYAVDNSPEDEDGDDEDDDDEYDGVEHEYSYENLADFIEREEQEAKASDLLDSVVKVENAPKTAAKTDQQYQPEPHAVAAPVKYPVHGGQRRGEVPNLPNKDRYPYIPQYARPRVFRDPASFPDMPPKKRGRPRKVNPTEGPAAKRARIKRTFKRFFNTPYEDGFSSQGPSTSSQILSFENLTDNGFEANNVTEKKPEFLIQDSSKDVKQEPIDDCEPVRGVQRALPNSRPIAVFNQTAKFDPRLLDSCSRALPFRPRRHVRLMPAPVAQAQKPGNRMPKKKPLPYETVTATVTAHNQRASSSMLQNGTSQSLSSNVFGQQVEAVEKKPDCLLPVEPQEVKQEPIDDYEPVTKANGLSSSWRKDDPKDEQKPNPLHLIKPNAVDANHALGNLHVVKRSNADECSRTLPFAPSPHKKVPVGQTPDVATATPSNRPQRLRVVKVIRKVGPPSNTPSTGIDANDETKFTPIPSSIVGAGIGVNAGAGLRMLGGENDRVCAAPTTTTTSERVRSLSPIPPEVEIKQELDFAAEEQNVEYAPQHYDNPRLMVEPIPDIEKAFNDLTVQLHQFTERIEDNAEGLALKDRFTYSTRINTMHKHFKTTTRTIFADSKKEDK